MRFEHITELIGNTPLLRLDPRVHGLDNVDLYAKLESHNPMGSVKDRVAWGMLRDDVAAIAASGQTLIEASSGNTAKALRVLAATHDIPVRAVTNRVKVDEVRDILQLLGADVVELPGLSDCPDPTAPNGVFAEIEKTMATQPGAFRHLSQYTNQKNIDAHYRGTGQEIYDDVGRVDYLFGGLGTTGSTRGAASYLLEKNSSMRTIGVVSDRTDFIPGIRSVAELWDVGLFQPDFYDEIVPINSGTAIDAMITLAVRYGVLAGPTSGATYAAARDVLSRDGDRSTPVVAVIIVCDRLEPYLSYVKKRQPHRFGQEAAGHAESISQQCMAAAPQLTPDQLEQLYRQRPPIIVDTRGAMAYRIGHVPGALNIRDDQLDDMLTLGMPFPRSLPVVFVCPVGEQSRKYAALAHQAGHEAASLAGGITGWRDSGKPLETAVPATHPG